MLGTNRFFFAMTTAAAAVAAVAAGCGGGSESTPGTGGSGGNGEQTGSSASTASSTTSTSSSTASSSPTTTSGSGVSSSSSASSSSGSGAGGGSACSAGEGTVLAINKLYFGDTTVQNPNQQDVNAWKQFGFNIDGKVSTAASKDVCQPAAGGQAAVAYPDGNNGIDNSFGKNILPILLLASPTLPADSNASIEQGTFTAMLKLGCLPPTGDVGLLETKLYVGTPLGAPPKFDGTDAWPVAPELLSDQTNIESSTVVFPKSSVTGELFSAGTNNTFIISIPLTSQTGSSTNIKLTVHAAQVTMNLDATRTGATGGLIGGVLNTEEFIGEIKKVGFLEGLCGSILFKNLETQVRQASDILTDGTQDPAKTCDGISIGIGFEMKQVKLGAVGPTTPAGQACP